MGKMWVYSGISTSVRALTRCDEPNQHRIILEPVVSLVKRSDRQTVFLCSYCDDLFDTKENLTNHVATFHKNVGCVICGRHFKRRCTLSRHINKVHEKSGRPQCHLCGQTFSRKHDVDRHLQRWHQ